MAIGTFFHSEPNSGPNKSGVTGTGPNGINDAVISGCGNTTFEGDFSIIACGGFSGNITAAGQVSGATGNFTGSVTASTLNATSAAIPTITGTASGNKTLASFDIPHVKDKGKRIRHIVAEGPEPGIYIRGKLNGSNIIELPEYWDGLVDPETITVTLTQIGSSQDLIVEDIKGRIVTLKSGTNERIHCFYEVWASRWLNPMNHNEKLLVVYEGESPNDYPGGNENFLIGGWDYDRRNTQWETPE